MFIKTNIDGLVDDWCKGGNFLKRLGTLFVARVYDLSVYEIIDMDNAMKYNLDNYMCKEHCPCKSTF